MTTQNKKYLVEIASAVRYVLTISFEEMDDEWRSSSSSSAAKEIGASINEVDMFERIARSA